jgi:DNA-binding SARP family transcriptional activator/tetratricopeptide (TPR) repeat protein
MSIAYSLGDVEVAATIANLLLTRPDLDEWQAPIARATAAIRGVALEAPLSEALEPLQQAAFVHERQQRWHLAAVSRLNLADIRRVAGDYEEAALDARIAVDHFRRSGGDAAELSSAFAVMGASLAAVDSLDEAAAAFAKAEGSSGTPVYGLEVSLLRAEFLADAGRLDEALATARDALNAAGAHLAPGALAVVATTGADVATKAYELDLAQDWLGRFDASRPTTESAAQAHQMLTRARLGLLRGDPAAGAWAAQGLELARSQGAKHLAWRAVLLDAVASHTTAELGRAVSEVGRARPSVLRSEAAVLSGAMDRLVPLPIELARSIEGHPDAWRPHFRRWLADSRASVRRANALLLDEHGEWIDVPRLRGLARDSAVRGVRHLGRELARRTAPRVMVQDLGRTTIEIGDRLLEATSMRRKVAGLVTYLLTRPGFTATREQVLEALWPDASPEVGTNSLHQTIYFLRRDIEPDFSDNVSPGYARLQGELVWLDPHLVDSASRQFFDLASRPGTDPEASVESAIGLYRGKFAPEFEYEDWAIPTRDALHAAFLDLVERALKIAAERGHWARGAELARAALAVDPAAEDIERNLIALYHQSGAHAAAAEQYAHFAASQRAEYGVEPPPLKSILPASEPT